MLQWIDVSDFWLIINVVDRFEWKTNKPASDVLSVDVSVDSFAFEET